MSVDGDSPHSTPIRRVRTVAAAVLGVVAVLGLTAATIGVWANRTLYDADAFADTISDVLAEPQVTDALAGYLAGEALRVVPVGSTLGEVLPEALEPAAPVVTNRLRGTLERQFGDLLARPATRDRVVRLARASHASLVRTIDTGGIANLKLDDGAVQMNLLPVVVDGIDALPTGVLGRALSLPELAYDGDHREQVAELSRAIGVDLPADTGLITVYRGAAVDRAGVALAQTQRALVVFHRSLTATILITAVALVAAVGLAPRRRAAVVGLAGGAAFAFAFAGVIVRRAIDEAPGVAVDPTNQTVVQAVVRGLSSGLVSWTNVAALAGLVVALAVAVTGLLGGRTAKTGS